MFEYKDPIKTGAILASLLWQQSSDLDFRPVSHAPDRYAEAQASSHDTPIGLKEVSRHRLWKVYVLQRVIEEVHMRLFGSNPEHLAQAKYVHSSKVELTFADGMKVLRKFAELEIDATGLQLDTIRASKAGNALEVLTLNNHRVHIDSATLRALVDPAYAEKMTQAYLKLRGPLEELEPITVASPQPT